MERETKPDTGAPRIPNGISQSSPDALNQLQPQVEAKLLAVHCEGFKTKIWATAYDAVYHDIARVLLPAEDHTEASQPQRRQFTF